MSSMTNTKIAEKFEQIADLLEFQGSNPFRIRAYRNGAKVIRDYPVSMASLIEDQQKDLTSIDGIGKDLAEKCQTLVQTGSLPMLDELLAEIPKTVLDLLRVPGLGPKKAATVHKELGIATLEELKAACESGKVQKLKGFGAKTEQAILGGLSIAAAANERILWIKANAIAERLRIHLDACAAIQKFDFAGSYRRGKETIGDLDILAVSTDADAVMDHFATFEDVASVIGRGGTKMSVRLENGFQVDLRVVNDKSFGAAMQYFTGSKEHNVIVRGIAKKRGLKVNEYGVFKTNDDQDEYVAGGSEEEVYAALGLPCFPPELREARREFDWAAAGQLPDLVQLKDIKADLHMHTVATDGKATIQQMIAAAQERGLKYIAITDHSKRVSMANGLDESRLLQQWQEIDRINEDLGKSFQVLKGIECDILEAGGMDLSDEVLAQADWVIASVHYGQKQPKAKITARILGAIQNPYVTLIAHPTGRLLNKREPYEVDLDEVFAAAAEHGTLMELNANPYRLDLDDVFCGMAKDQGIPIVINTDAHSVDGLDVMACGIQQARRAGLTKQDVANTRTWNQLQKLLRK